ncbi:MAG: hypothetical protein QM489_06880 [Candidatus Izemoplasma sp.]
MIKAYSQNRSNVILNFSVYYCKTPQELIKSEGFKKVLKKYISTLENKDALLLEHLNSVCKERDFTKTILELFKLLLVLDTSEISKLNKEFKLIFNQHSDLLRFVEGFYNYWRHLERYALIQSKSSAEGINDIDFIEANNDFSSLVSKIYRLYIRKLLGHHENVYRQLNAGINAGLVLTEYDNLLPEAYKSITGVQFIKSIVFTPPFIVYPKSNTRSGIFEEIYSNPLIDLKMKASHYFCYPAMVGESLTFVYFHRDFMNHGVSLSNLFKLAEPHEYLGKKPDLIYVFGGKKSKGIKETVFFQDKPNDIFVGFVSNIEEVDYFGYMKKMILTLHNVRMIEKGLLPVHGAMVNVTLKNGVEANIVIIGDSGAGKSESLEAFRKLSKKYLKELKIIFDDMGTLAIENNKVVGWGTEIGAFVRLDDLEGGYVFNEMDRAIIMNPNKINARLIIPIASYEDIINKYEVDMVLYANNFEDPKQTLVMFDDAEAAKKVFVKGLRKAKGTTTEKGIVESYFANPFGPVQRKEQTDIIIDSIFEKLFKDNIDVGQIYTKLGIEGCEQSGPKKAAIKLFDWLKTKK